MSDTLEIVETFGPVHPGAILREEFIAPLGLTAGRVAKVCGLAGPASSASSLKKSASAAILPSASVACSAPRRSFG